MMALVQRVVARELRRMTGGNQSVATETQKTIARAIAFHEISNPPAAKWTPELEDEYSSYLDHHDNKGITDFDAVMIAEGAQEADEETQLAAWQHLVDTGLAWQLQGSFGRQAARMIDAGLIQPAQSKEPGA